jgi:hypothetical protein
MNNLLRAAWVLLVLLLACDGCQEPSAGRRDARNTSSDRERSGGVEPAELPPPIVDEAHQRYLLSLAGRVDVMNRFRSTVRIRTELSDRDARRCGGAVIAPRLVLTAGHCVCQPRKSVSEPGTAQSLIDGSSCMKSVFVEARLYEPDERYAEWENTESRWDTLSGTVRPHPELRVLLDEQGRVTSSQGDLAVVVLERPFDFKEALPPFPLAEEELQPGETVIIVGAGYDEVARTDDGQRRFSRNKVTEPLPSGGGSMRIEQPGGHYYRGDSGGPCLREDSRGYSLVGISSRNLGEGAALTSTHGYRDWLREMIADSEALSRN